VRSPALAFCLQCCEEIGRLVDEQARAETFAMMSIRDALYLGLSPSDQRAYIEYFRADFEALKLGIVR
jgi:hypothetical protein